MRNGLLVALIVGILLGAVGMRFLGNDAVRPVSRALPAADLEEADQISDLAEQSLRETRYEGVGSIEDVLALPSAFAELEAIYAIAGRADSAEVQNLIYQALRVVDPGKREALVQALLVRLVELDPRSAVALVGGPLQRSDGKYANVVWRTWATRDFDAALSAATELIRGRRMVAQALYASLTSLQSPRAADIETLLGVKPDDDARTLFLARLYQDSPEEALRYIGSLKSSEERLEQVNALAALAFDARGTEALAFASRLPGRQQQSKFRYGVLKAMADQDPDAAVALMLADPGGDDDKDALGYAIGLVAKDDPDTALRYVEQAPALRRVFLEHKLIMAAAEEDPERALMLARNARFGVSQNLLRGAITTIAKTDLDRALQLVDGLEDGNQKGFLLMNLADSADAESMPRLAATVLDQRHSGYFRSNALNMLSRQWVTKDVEGAIAWAETLEPDDRREVIESIVSRLLDTDSERAMQYAQSLTGPTGDAARKTLTGAMAARGLVDEALTLARATEDPVARKRAEMQVIQSVANSDPERALTLANATGDAAIRDTVLSRSSFDLAQSNPTLAYDRAKMIEDPLLRSNALQWSISSMASDNFEQARVLVAGMEDGQERDSGLAGLAISDALEPDAALDWAAKIGDDEKRQQAQAEIIFQLVRADPASAVRLANDIEFSSRYREQLEAMFTYNGYSL